MPTSLARPATPRGSRATRPPRVVTAALALEDALERCVARASVSLARRARAWAKLLPDQGSIDLPDTAPGPVDAGRLAVAAPLYVAHELDRAGLLRAAEQVAGLFASGALTQDLGPLAAVMNDFWRDRHARLGDQERGLLLGQVFDAGFYAQMRALCAALAARTDNANVPDVRENVSLDVASARLAEHLAQRTQGMVAFAAQDLIDTINVALSFLRDRVLQLAFSAHDLWELIEICARYTASPPDDVRARADLARSGTEVLAWLAQPGVRAESGGMVAVESSAIRWLAAHESVRGFAAAPRVA